MQGGIKLERSRRKKMTQESLRKKAGCLTTEGVETRLRCEAMTNRQLNHTIAELERVQVARKK